MCLIFTQTCKRKKAERKPFDFLMCDYRAANQFLSLFLGTPHLQGLLSLGSPSAAEDQQMIDDNLRMFFVMVIAKKQ